MLRAEPTKMVIIYFLELLWPEGDEALSEHAVDAVESILVLEAVHRPGAKGYTFCYRWTQWILIVNSISVENKPT